jgi:hypothetical protein
VHFGAYEHISNKYQFIPLINHPQPADVFITVSLSINSLNAKIVWIAEEVAYMKKLRIITLVAILALALLMTGCFSSPGEDLIGTWVSEPFDADGLGAVAMTIEIKANPFHLPMLVAHAYAYNATVTYGGLQWIIPIPNDEQRKELLSLLTDALNENELDEEDLPDFPAFGWACVSLFGQITKEMAGVYYPATTVGEEPTLPMPALFMQGNFTAGTGFIMEVMIGTNIAIPDIRFTPASGN